MIKRYQTDEIAAIFNDQYRFKKWLIVEEAVARVEERNRIIPKGLSRNLSRVKVDPARVSAIERITNHDVIAFLQAVREQLGEEGRWLHFGLTSYDLVDTAQTMIIGEALRIVIGDVERLRRVLGRLAYRYRLTPQMGRTHGVSAQPITFGYKVASWCEEIKRALRRFRAAQDEIAYGKLSGAVGAYTMLRPGIERSVMKSLGLRPEPVSTQVLPRDRFAYLVSVLVLYGCGLERIATEIRNLSRTEIGELSEPFTRGQKGSSAMPHKKNPITCERICGLSRILRGLLIPAYENINLWHERDITNSSAERVILPDAFHLTHYMTKKMLWVLSGLRVFPAQMSVNIRSSLGVYASQSLMNRLVEKGMATDRVYKIIQALCFRAVEQKQDLKILVLKDRTVKRYLGPKDIERIFDLDWFIRNIKVRPRP